MTNNTEYGYIYVLTNKYMPNLVKIGKTSKANVNERLKSLYYGNSALPCNFDCEYSYRVPLDKLDAIEKKLHTYFAAQRVNESREFFEVSAEEVAKLFWAYDEIFAEATTEIQQKIDFVTSQVSIKLSMLFFTELDLKSYGKNLHKRPQIAKAILRKKNGAGGIRLPDF